MSKILKFKYWVSVSVFFGILLYVYALLPEQVGVYYDNIGSPVVETSKAMFFYTFIGLFIITNGIIMVYQGMLVPKKDVSMQYFSELPFIHKLYHWMTGLSTIFNVTFSFSLLYVGLYNSRDVNPDHYLSLVFIGPVFLVCWLIYLLYLKVMDK